MRRSAVRHSCQVSLHQKKCAAFKDAEKAAAEDVEDEGEDDAKAVRPRRPVVWRRLHAIDATRSDRVARPQCPAQVEDVYKAAEDLNVFEWARIDKGDDDLALETLVSAPWRRASRTRSR